MPAPAWGTAAGPAVLPAGAWCPRPQPPPQRSLALLELPRCPDKPPPRPAAAAWQRGWASASRAWWGGRRCGTLSCAPARCVAGHPAALPLHVPSACSVPPVRESWDGRQRAPERRCAGRPGGTCGHDVLRCGRPHAREHSALALKPPSRRVARWRRTPTPTRGRAGLHWWGTWPRPAPRTSSPRW